MNSRVLFAARAVTPVEEISDAAILITDGRIRAIGSRSRWSPPAGAEVYDAGEATIVPGFVDLHVHGAGGRDVLEATPDALETIARTLALRGTTSFLATTVTSSLDALCRSAAAVRAFIQQQAQSPGSAGCAQLLGTHFEGPFISKIRRGVHPEAEITAPQPALLARLLEAAAGTARILTLAPELPGALELIDQARAQEVIVSLGHSDATYEQALAAVARGARRATHVFNAMRPFSHRQTGIVGAVLTSPQLTAELIADGIHVDGTAMKILFAAKGTEGVSLVSDGISATGMPDGNYRLGELAIEVSGGVARNGEGRLAGSVLTLDRALRNVVALGVPLRAATQMLTLNPARELGLEGSKGLLAPGAAADLVLLNAKLEIVRVMSCGAWVG
jgi:N-acetylglucosamine-6-phosphate deacetylase